MVDGISSAASGSYAPYQSSGRQTSTLTVETQEQTVTAQIKQGGQNETLSYYSKAVTIKFRTGSGGTTLSAAASAQLQDGQQALATVQQTAAEASDFRKNDAKQKLQLALSELKLLKLLGQTPAGAKEAAQLAKQIADAASEYASAGGAEPADSADASDTTGDVADATDGTAAATAATPSSAASATASSSTTDTTGAAAASAAGSTAQAATSNGTTPADNDPFFQEVQAALKELKKFLRKTLPGLEASPDEKVRKLAKEVEKSFNESVAQIASAEAEFNAESALGAADDTTALGGADSAASVAASVVAGTYQPVNISA